MSPPVRKGATTPTTSTVPLSLTPIPTGYRAWLAALKADIRATQLRASVAVNRELVLMYWRIGRDILERQAKDGWGSKVVDRIARDLNAEFPDMRGFSSRNLQYMRAFAEAWPDAVIVQQAAAQGCGSSGTAGDGSSFDHLTKVRWGWRGGTTAGTTPSAYWA